MSLKLKLKRLFNSIRVRLIACFVGLLLISAATTLFLINYALNSIPLPPAPQFGGPGMVLIAPEGSAGGVTSAPGTITVIRQQYQSQFQQDRQALQDKVLAISVGLIVLQILIASVGGYFLIRKTLNPLHELDKLMSELNDERLTSQISTKGKATEIRSLVKSFNAMVLRLNKTFSGQKQFVENVSHEIKTPLTIVKTNLEAILYDDSMSKAELETSIKAAIGSINFLNTLTEDLLLLSIVDKKGLGLEELDLRGILVNTLADLTPLAAAKNIQLEFEGAKRPKVKAQKVLLKRALANVIENAIKYSAAKTTVKVSLQEEKGQAVIKVKDEGPGIPAEFRDRIFERFFRVDKSRSRKSGGTGLGLAIAKEVAELFGGSVTFASRLKGSIFSINLPLFT